MTGLANGKPAPPGFFGMMGAHPSMVELFRAIERAARIDCPVILIGETGTGKELVANAIHALSGRAGEIVAVNMASIPGDVAESELFGSVRGAYTGAVDRAGLVESADRGTLHLDEASEMTGPVQAKLLRVLESGMNRRVGATRERRVGVRAVLSVQGDPLALVQARRWRADFFHRVAGVLLRVPPLRERRTDVPVLAQHFLRGVGRHALGREHLRPLEDHSWPGNVRELRRVVERAAFMAGGAVVEARHLEAALTQLPQLGERLTASIGDRLDDVVRHHIVRVFEDSGRHVDTAAARLGLSRDQLYRKLRAFGVQLSWQRRMAESPS